MKEKTQHSTTVIDRLEQLMQHKGISKADMARAVHVSPQAVNSWFRRGDIGKNSAIKLADYFNVSVAWLLGEGDASLDDKSPPRPELSEREKILLQLFNELPNDEADKLLKTLNEKKQYYDQLLDELIEKKSSKRA